MNTKEIESAVSNLLATAGAMFHAAYVGQTKRDDWDCDEWRVTLKCNRVEYSFEFFTGLGLRKRARTAEAFRNGVRPGTLAYEAWQKAFTKPQTPSSASVLHSLILDGEAINQSFVDWCSDFGYSEDSRKALSIYDACCESGRKLRALFTIAQRDALREILAD